jgi:aspartyl-tRNA(Asn)/glutamyl-tRNA(Gln) amidotransferase subunit A
MVSAGLPDVAFPSRDELFRVGLTILLVEAAAFHRRWATECPEKYGSDVIGHIRRGLGILAVDFEEALAAWPRLRAEAHLAMEVEGIDALLLPATAIVAPPITAGDEVREPLARFTRPFNTTGQPVVTLPAPVSGLPVGIQVVASTNSGAINVAAALESRWRERRS